MTKANDDAAEAYYMEAMQRRNDRVDQFIADMGEHLRMAYNVEPRYSTDSEGGRRMWSCIAAAIDRMEQRRA